MERTWSIVFAIIIGIGCGIYYFYPTPITFGCMAADIYMGVLAIIIDIVEILRKDK